MTPALTSQVFGQLDADFRPTTSPHSIHSPSSFWDTDCAAQAQGRLLTKQGQHCSSLQLSCRNSHQQDPITPTLSVPRGPQSHKRKSPVLSAWRCQRCSEGWGKTMGFVVPSPAGQAGSFQALHRVSNGTDAAQHLQPLTLGLIHHPAETEKPGSSFI